MSRVRAYEFIAVLMVACVIGGLITIPFLARQKDTGWKQALALSLPSIGGALAILAYLYAPASNDFRVGFLLLSVFLMIFVSKVMVKHFSRVIPERKKMKQELK